MDTPYSAGVADKTPKGDLYPYASEGTAGNLGEWIQLAIWDIGAFFGNQDSASHAAALRAVNAQKTPEDKTIFKTVESANITHTGLLGVMDNIGNVVRGFFSGITSVIGFVLKNIKWIIILAAIGYFGWLFIKVRNK